MLENTNSGTIYQLQGTSYGYWEVDAFDGEALKWGGFATMAIGDGYNYGVWKSRAAVWKCSDGVWKCMLNPSTTRHSFSGGGPPPL